MLFLVLCGAPAAAQKKYYLHLTASDAPSAVSKEEKEIRHASLDSLHCIQSIRNAVEDLQGKGRLAAGVDSIRFAGDTCTAFLYAGPLLNWVHLGRGNVDESLLKGSRYHERSFRSRPYDAGDYRAITEKILENCENNGYPFAAVRLDSVILTDTSVYGVMQLDRGRFVKIDSVTVRNKQVIAPVYLYNYLGIKPGDPYNESQIRKISTRFKELSFAREASPARVIFTEQYTKLELNPESRRASQFDGILGLLAKNGEPGKYTLTGEIHLKLQNSFRRGEIIDLNWKALPSQSQDLKFRFYYPFLFNTPFGVDFYLGVFKKDTSYIDVDRTIGIQYQFTGNNFVKGFAEFKESNLVSTTGLENITTLPSYADIDQTSYGLTIHHEDLDYRINPHLGHLLELTGSAGNRSVRKNPDVNPAVYDSIDLESVRYWATLAFDYFIPLASRHVIDAGILGGYQTRKGSFDNELFRLGGLHTLRGFDDESILASAYGIAKLEYRYILELNSYLFTFFNTAWYEKVTNLETLRDTPYGFGAGIAFETRLGIVSVNYALGAQQDRPVQFRSAKVHIGLLNYF